MHVNGDIELLHRKFCKMVLNVPPSATNVAVYGELGRMPMYLLAGCLYLRRKVFNDKVLASTNLMF